MSEVTRRACDRCGDTVKNDDDDRWPMGLVPVVRDGFSSGRWLDGYDLCTRCEGEFFDWLDEGGE